MSITHLFSLACTGTLFFVVLFMILRNYLREGYALLWLAVTLGLGILSVFPGLLDKIALYLGIQTPAFALMIFIFGGMTLILIQQSIVLSRHNEKIKRLGEELALLREELREKNNE